MTLKYCQGPNCHMYQTKDRIRGPQGASIIRLEEDHL